MNRDELIERVVADMRDAYERQETWHTVAARIVDRLEEERSNGGSNAKAQRIQKL
jgi:hypothetical protein